MNENVITAVFPDHGSAEKAIDQLRQMGVPESSISVVAQHAGQTQATGEVADHDHDGDNKASGALKGAGIGAGVGLLFGLAALAIPGVGPFVTAGALANALGTAGGTAAAGAIVGGTAGTITGMLEDYGVKNEDAKYYSQRVEQGGVFVGVATNGVADPATVRQVFQSCGGQSGAYMA